MDSSTTTVSEAGFVVAAPPGPGLLGVPSDELALRICTGPRREETFRLADRKCTIGSDPACTLQLDELGIRPFHCLILRGKSQTVIRRWSPDTRLNGAEFTDAVLQQGDRLTVGSLELEVLAAGATPRAEPPPTPEPVPIDEPAPVDEQNRAEELRSLERELAEREQTWRLRCEQREAEFAKWQQQLLARREELDSERRALEADRAAFSTERRDWETVQDEARTRLNEKLEQANHRLAELAAERQSHERRRSAWTAQRQNLTEELNSQFQTLREEQSALKAAQDGLAEARTSLEAEERLRQEQFAQRQRELDRLRGEIEAERAQRQAQWEQDKQAWDAERARWEQQRTELAAQPAAGGEQLAALDARESELSAQRAALEAERLEWLAQRSQGEIEAQSREARLIGQQQEIDRRQEEFAAQLSAFEERRRDWETERRQREDQLALREATVAQAESQTSFSAGRDAAPDGERSVSGEERGAQQFREQESAERLAAREREIEQILVASEQEIARLHDELAAERQEVLTRQQRFDEERAAWLTERRRAEEALAEERQRFEQERAGWEANREPPIEGSQDPSPSLFVETPSEPSPRSTADLLSRFGLGSRSAPAENAGRETGPDAKSEPSEEPAEAPRSVPLATAKAAEAADEAEEDSIDDYMAKLLQRLGSRGAAGQSLAEAPNEPVEPPPLEPPAAAEEIVRSATITFKEPAEMAPRAVPAELSSDMSAMRALAIQNAQAALETHARRIVLKRGPVKLLLAITAGASAALLAWFHLLGHEQALLFALACLIVAAAYFWQFHSLRRGARGATNKPRPAPSQTERDPFSALRISDLPADDADDQVA